MLTVLLALSLTGAWFTNPDQCTVRVNTDDGTSNTFDLLDSDCELEQEWEVISPCSASCSWFGVELLQKAVVKWETGHGRPCAFNDRFMLRECPPLNQTICTNRTELICEYSEWSDPVINCTDAGVGAITSTKTLTRGEEGCNETLSTTHPCPVGMVYHATAETDEYPDETISEGQVSICWGSECVDVYGNFGPIDCETTSWSLWSECSSPCAPVVGEGGFRTRTRNVVTVPRNGGESCPALYESEPCNYNIVCDSTHATSPSTMPSKQVGHSAHNRVISATFPLACASLQVSAHVLC